MLKLPAATAVTISRINLTGFLVKNNTSVAATVLLVTVKVGGSRTQQQKKELLHHWACQASH
jgi:hypothetical protein